MNTYTGAAHRHRTTGCLVMITVALQVCLRTNNVQWSNVTFREFPAVALGLISGNIRLEGVGLSE